MTPTREDTIDIFKGLMPCVENPPHSNHTKIGVEYGWDGVPWCCECVSCVIKRAFGTWINKTAGVADLVNRAKRGDNGWKWLDKNQPLMVADILPYDWKLRGNSNDMHVEMCLNPSIQSSYQDIGGNVNDAISMPWRDRTFLMGIIRPPYANSPGIVIPPPVHSTGAANDTLNFGGELHANQEIRSSSGLFLFLMQGDGNAVLYKEGSPRQALWATGSNGAEFIAMQGDDNLVVYAAGKRPVWASNTSHMAGNLHSRLVVQSDGNLVIYTDANKPIWDCHRGKI